MNEIQIPWEAGKPGPSHSISGYVGGGPVVESYGVPEAYLRAAGYVPAALLTQERETSRRLQAALNRIVGFVSAEQAGWAIYDAEVSQ